MANVGSVTFDIAAESAKLRSELDKVRKDVGQIKGVAKGIEDGFKNVGTFIAGAFSVAAIGAFLGKVNQAADRLNDLGDRLKASASGLQVLEVAAQQAGGSAEALDRSIEKMNISIGEALAGNKLTAEAFDRLGLSAQKLGAMKADEAFTAISGAVGQIPNSFERASVAQAIFGKGAKEIAGLLAEGTGAIDDARAALERQGAVLSDLDVKKIGVMNDELALQGTIVQNLGTKFLANLSPAVSVAVDAVGDLMANMGGATNAGKSFGVVMTAAIKMVEAGVYGLATVFESIRAVVAAVLSGMVSGVSKVLGVLASAGEVFGLGFAGPLRTAATNAELFAESLNAVAVSAKANAQAAAAAAIKAGADVFNAAEIFEQKSAELDARAAAAAARATAAQGEYSGFTRAGAAAGEGIGLSDKQLAGAFGQIGALQPKDIATDPEVVSEQLAADAKLAIHERYAQTRIGQIEALENTTLGMVLNSAQLQQQIEANKNATMGDMMGSLVGMAMQQGGKLGKVGKALAIAQTVWSTSMGIMRAIAENPWPANIAAAALVAGMGVAQLANIKKTNIGSGGAVVGAGGSTPSASAPSLSDNVPGTTQPQDMKQSAVNIYVQGSLFAAQETVEWLTEKIAEAVNGRDLVFINGSSRQAMELRGT